MEEIPTIENAGSQEVIVKVEKENHKAVEVTVTATVTPKEATVTAQDQVAAFGSVEAVKLTYTTEGFVKATDVKISIATTVNNKTNVGTYVDEITVTGTENPNYKVTYVPADFTITEAELGADVTAYAGVYDGNAHNSVTVTPDKDGTKVTYSIDGGATWLEEIPTIENAGSQEIIVKVEKANHKAVEVTVTAKVAPKSVIVTANSDSHEYDGTEKTLSGFTVTGLVGEATLTTEKEVTRTDIGTTAHVLTEDDLTITGDVKENYTFTFVDGALTINPVTEEEQPPVDPNEPNGQNDPNGSNDPNGQNDPNGSNEPNEPETPRDLEAEDAEDAEDADTTILDDELTPLGGLKSHWALVNLLLSILGVLMAVIFLFKVKKKKRDEENEEKVKAASANEEDEEDEEEKPKRLFGYKLLNAVLAVVAVIVFLLTQDITLPMILVDFWTIIHFIIVVLQIVVMIFGKNKKDDKDEDEYEDKEETVTV